MYARQFRLLCRGEVSECPTSRLQDERNDITSDECERVSAGPETGVFFSVDDDDACEAEVNGSGEECWCDREADEVASLCQDLSRREKEVRWHFFFGGTR